MNDGLKYCQERSFLMFCKKAEPFSGPVGSARERHKWHKEGCIGAVLLLCASFGFLNVFPELFDVLQLPDSCVRCVGNTYLNGMFTDA